MRILSSGECIKLIATRHPPLAGEIANYLKIYCAFSGGRGRCYASFVKSCGHNCVLSGSMELCCECSMHYDSHCKICKIRFSGTE